MDAIEKNTDNTPDEQEIKKTTKTDKLMSGRWLLTLGVFISIVMMSFANVRVVLKDPTQKPPFEMKELMIAVVVFYFTRTPSNEK